MKDEIKYDIQFFYDGIDDWDSLNVVETKKEAKDTVRDCKRLDKKDGVKLKYRIIKLTIKKEVIK